MRNYKVKPVESLSRGLRVLQLLQEVRAASLHDLHLATGIPKSTLTRILYTAHRQGLVWQRMADGAFLPIAPSQEGVALPVLGSLDELPSILPDSPPVPDYPPAPGGGNTHTSSSGSAQPRVGCGGRRCCRFPGWTTWRWWRPTAAAPPSTTSAPGR